MQAKQSKPQPAPQKKRITSPTKPTEPRKIGFILEAVGDSKQAFMVAPPWFLRSLAAELAPKEKKDKMKTACEVKMLAFSDRSMDELSAELGSLFALRDTATEKPKHEKMQGLPALYLPIQSPGFTGMACAFYRAARNKHVEHGQPFDVLCADSIESARLALDLRDRGYARKVVYVAHQLLRHLAHWTGTVNQRNLETEVQVLRNADAVVLLNEIQAGNFNTYYAAPPSQTVKVIGSGLPFKPAPPATSETPSATEFCLGAASAFCTESDYESLAYALRRLANAGSVRLRIAGDPGANLEWHGDFLRLAADLGVLEYIEWVGWLTHEEMPVFYQKCHLTVVPSVADTVGLPGLESLQLGVPVIASDSAGLLPEILERINREAGGPTPDPAGAVVPKRSPWALAEAATAIYQHQAKLIDDQLLRWRGELRQHVEPALTDYSWGKVADEYRKLFAGLFDPNETEGLLRRQQTNLIRDRLQQRMQTREISLNDLALRLTQSYESIRRIFDRTATRVVRWSTFERLMEKLDYSKEEIAALREDYERGA